MTSVYRQIVQHLNDRANSGHYYCVFLFCSKLPSLLSSTITRHLALNTVTDMLIIQDSIKGLQALDFECFVFQYYDSVELRVQWFQKPDNQGGMSPSPMVRYLQNQTQTARQELHDALYHQISVMIKSSHDPFSSVPFRPVQMDLTSRQADYLCDGHQNASTQSITQVLEPLGLDFCAVVHRNPPHLVSIFIKQKQNNSTHSTHNNNVN